MGSAIFSPEDRLKFHHYMPGDYLFIYLFHLFIPQNYLFLRIFRHPQYSNGRPLILYVSSNGNPISDTRELLLTLSVLNIILFSSSQQTKDHDPSSFSLNIGYEHVHSDGKM